MPAPVLNFTSNGNQSDAISIDNSTLVGLFIPEEFNGGSLTFQTSLDGSEYFPVEDGVGNAVTVVVGDSPCYVPVDFADFLGIRYLKVTMNTNSNADFSITPAIRNVV